MIPMPILDAIPSWLHPAAYQSPARPYPVPQSVPPVNVDPMDIILADCLVEETRPE